MAHYLGDGEPREGRVWCQLGGNGTSPIREAECRGMLIDRVL